MNSIVTRILLIGGVSALALFLLPSSFDPRPTLYDNARWIADSLCILVGYVAFILGLSLLPVSGGQMRRGLYWFVMGTFIMGTSCLFGPLINHYHIFGAEFVKASHGLGMIGGMIGFLLATYLFLTIVGSKTFSKRFFLFCFLVFVTSLALFYPTMFAERSIGSDINYWTDLFSFGIGMVMLTMIIRSFRRIGPGYRKVMIMMFVSTIFMTLTFPAGIISQPNSFWNATQGGVFHHGFMVFSVTFFLITVFYLKRLEIYSSPSASDMQIPNTLTGTQ